MSVIVHLCEDPCPLHANILCHEARGHEPPHRCVLHGAKPGDPSIDRIVIEWRKVTHEEARAATAEEMRARDPGTTT